MNRLSVTHPIKKKKAHRGSRGRGGKAKKAKQAKKAKELMESKKSKEVSRGTQSDLDTAPGTSASGTAPRLTFIGEVLTEEEAAFLTLCLQQFRVQRLGSSQFLPRRAA
ncbi:Glycoside hydrolase family 47 [Penicillium sp. CMV-2018d]|nr:Glycoside hydrolase family 47 [Penicillium sp. CMV-2018d]